jgi:hypothetical protein
MARVTTCVHSVLEGARDAHSDVSGWGHLGCTGARGQRQRELPRRRISDTIESVRPSWLGRLGLEEGFATPRRAVNGATS